MRPNTAAAVFPDDPTSFTVPTDGEASAASRAITAHLPGLATAQACRFTGFSA
ncbi:hypothetical protein AB0M39_08200 [Streptomyces sp. NPDC051907]|uniref:hypothetical protein n=1 Tax=Streptomyces sp. NPDC051907 TaxID=3155284 RepID=UPI003448D346